MLGNLLSIDIAMPNPVPIALALGSNLGDREHNLSRALDCISQAEINIQGISSPLPTLPVDCHPDAPPYLNQALIATTSLAPLQLLATCQNIEVHMGRQRHHCYHDDRIIDIDILLYDQEIIDLPVLRVPHPGIHSRHFVLEPLSQIAPDWIIPGVNISVLECMKSLANG